MIRSNQVAYRALSYLQEKQLVNYRRIGDRLQVCLTSRGAARLLIERMQHIKERLTPGELCVVIFDFPETERNHRNQWRRFLKLLRFRQLQKSVWVTDRDIALLLATMIEDVGLTAWIHVLYARQFTNEKI